MRAAIRNFRRRGRAAGGTVALRERELHTVVHARSVLSLLVDPRDVEPMTY